MEIPLLSQLVFWMEERTAQVSQENSEVEDSEVVQHRKFHKVLKTEKYLVQKELWPGGNLFFSDWYLSYENLYKKLEGIF